MEKSLIPSQRIADLIFLIRDKKIMLDADLALLYGVTTKVLNQAVKRNSSRFPNDFMFILDEKEKAELVTICDRFNRLKHSTALPHAFTEHGAIMLANVLRSKRAIRVSLDVVRAFTHLREMLSSHKELARKVALMERRYDSNFKEVFSAIKNLMNPSDPLGIDPPRIPCRVTGFKKPPPD